MGIISSLLKVRIKPMKNPWLKRIVLIGFFVLFGIGFSDVCATIVRSFCGQPPYPFAFWLATVSTFVMSVWFLYIIIDEYRFGPRRKRIKKEKRDL